ncbi:MAG: hypothetical protein KC503_39440 [Myxococcales bacterium]|nr:hypothetical protein [Myxococcales bacterium]
MSLHSLRLALLLSIVALPSLAHAGPGSPFFRLARAKDGRAKDASPFQWKRVAQKSPPPAKTQPAAAAPATSAPPPKVDPKTAIGKSCQSDAQCGVGNFCHILGDHKCHKVTTPINVMYLFYRSGDKRFTEALGIYWHHAGTPGYRVVFPFYWRFSDKTSRSRVFFPFYWRFEDDKAKTVSVIVPPFQYRRAPGERNYRFWPLLFWTDYDKGAGLTVLPLFHYSRNDTKRLLVLPPLLTFWGSDSKNAYSRGLLFGIYYWKRHEQQRANAIFPLFYHSSGPQSSFTWVLPLNFHAREGDTKTTALLPLFYYRRRPGESTTIAPLFYRHRTRDSATTVLFPLLWHSSSPRRSYTTLLPIFYYRKVDGGRRANVFSPLFLYERDDAAKVTQWGMLVPPFYHRRDSHREVDTLFPLVWRWYDKVERTTNWVVPPFWYHHDPEGDTQILFPLFWRFADRQSGNATSVLFPIFYRNSSPDGTSFNLLFPLYYRSKKTGWSAGIFPLLFTGATQGHRHAVLFPAFWHIKNPRTSTTVLGPLYFRREYGSGWQAGLAPIFFAGRRGGDRYQVLFPAFWHVSSVSDGYDTWIAGPFVRSKSRKGTVTGLLPLFATGHWKGRDYTTVLPPLFYRSSDPRTGEHTTLAGLYYSFREKRRAGWTVFPLAHHRAQLDAKGAVLRSDTTVLPLFYYKRTREQRLLVTPLGGFERNSRTGLRRNVIGPVIWGHSSELSGFAVIPLLFHYKRPKEKSTTTIILPFGVRHDSPKQKALVVFPIYWHIADPKQRNLAVFPFYFRQREKGGENFTVIFPLVWRFWNQERKTLVYGPYISYRHWSKREYKRTDVLFPFALYQRDNKSSYLASLPFIFYHNDFKERRRLWIVGPFYYRTYRGEDKDEHGYSLGLMPLLFHKNTRVSSYTHVPPLFWHWRNTKARTSTTFVGPFFYRRNNDHSAFGLAPIFYHGSSPSERTTAFFPLFYNHKGIGKWRFFTPIFGLELSSDQKLWYVPPILHARTLKRTLTMTFPLFVYHRNHLTQRSTFFSLPSYYGTWSKESAFHLLFPLYWRYRDVDSSATVAFPLYWDFNNRFASRTTVLFPLLMRHRDNVEKATSWFVVPNVYVRSREKSSDVLVFPLFWHFGGVKRATTIGFPLYWYFRRPSYRTRVVFPLFWDIEKAKDHYTLVANAYYWRSKVNDRWAFHFFPLFTVARDRPGDFRWEVLPGGLFGYQRIGRNRFVKLLFFINIKLDPLPATPGAQPQPRPQPRQQPPAKGGGGGGGSGKKSAGVLKVLTSPAGGEALGPPELL